MLAALSRFFVFPSRLVRGAPDAGRGVPRLERHWLATDEGDVEWWLLRAETERPAPAVFFTHGNAELIEQWPEALAGYAKLGMHVVLPEYRGYGRSAGKPGERAIREDLVRIRDLVAARADVDATKLVYHGRSIGGGTVCQLAKERPPAALVLMSTFTSIPDIARRFFVPRGLVTEVFDNETVVRGLRDVPLLLVHGTADALIPFSHAERLARAHGDARLVREEGAEHNDCPRSWPAFYRELAPFLRDAGILGA